MERQSNKIITAPTELYNLDGEGLKSKIEILPDHWQTPVEDLELKNMVSKMEDEIDLDPKRRNGILLTIDSFEESEHSLVMKCKKCTYAEYLACIKLDRKEIMNVLVLASVIISADGDIIIGDRRNSIGLIGGTMNYDELENLAQADQLIHEYIIKKNIDQFSAETMILTEIYEELGINPYELEYCKEVSVVTDKIPRSLMYFVVRTELNTKEILERFQQSGNKSEHRDLEWYDPKTFMKRLPYIHHLKLTPALINYITLKLNK